MNISPSAPDYMKIDNLIGKSIAILGVTGSGKSTTAAVMAEEFLENNVPITIVDIAGEYWGLKQRYSVLTAGKSLYIEPDIKIDSANPQQAADLARFSINERLPVILDISAYTPSERNIFLGGYFTQIWREGAALRQPYYMFLEEASNYIAQQKPGPLTEVLTTIASEGRKLGLGLVVIGQRSTRIDKNVLSQARVAFIHRMLYPNDIKICQDLLPSDRNWVKQQLISLETGQAIVRWDDKVEVLQIRPRYTFHGGYTPQVGENEQPVPLKSLDYGLLGKLENIMQQSQSSGEDDLVVSEAIPKSRRKPKLMGHEHISHYEWKVPLGTQLVGGSIETDAVNVKTKVINITSDGEYVKIVPDYIDETPVEDQIDEPDEVMDEMEPINVLDHTGRYVDTEKEVVKKHIDNLETDFSSLQARLDVLETNFDKVHSIISNLASIFSALNMADIVVPAQQTKEELSLEKKNDISKQEMRFKAMLRDISAMSLQQKKVMLYLFERDDRSFTLRQLAQATGYALNSMKNRPPVKLVDLGLLLNTGGEYRSTAYEMFHRTYPDLDETFMVQNFMKVINE